MLSRKYKIKYQVTSKFPPFYCTLGNGKITFSDTLHFHESVCFEHISETFRFEMEANDYFKTEALRKFPNVHAAALGIYNNNRVLSIIKSKSSKIVDNILIKLPVSV